MKTFRRSALLLFILTTLACHAIAQQKLLTIDDIFDPVKRINFNGNPPNLRWLKDGKHYLLANEATRKDVPRLQKVDAMTGKAVAFFDTAKMQAAFNALGGVTTADAARLANRGSYDLSKDESAVLINWNNDLFYYELGSDKALRVTNDPEEEVGETFSPDGRMLGFVRGGNIYVYDIAGRQERRLN